MQIFETVFDVDTDFVESGLEDLLAEVVPEGTEHTFGLLELTLDSVLHEEVHSGP